MNHPLSLTLQEISFAFSRNQAPPMAPSPPAPRRELGHSLGPPPYHSQPRSLPRLCGALCVRASVDLSLNLNTLKCGVTKVGELSRSLLAQCPYSCKLYKTMRREVLPHYRGKDFRFTFHHQVQPLRAHFFTPVLVRTSLNVQAVQTLLSNMQILLLWKWRSGPKS